MPSPKPRLNIRIESSASSFFQTNEIRISSKRNPDRPFDYDIGWFSKHSGGQSAQNLFQYLPGSFGAPNALPGTGTFNSAYALPVALTFPIAQVFDSFYGNVRFHIGQHTELAGGLAIIRAVVAMADSLEMSTTAEGVENEAELAIVRRLGCKKIQGYYFGRPMTVEDCDKLLMRGASQLRVNTSAA